MKVLEGRWKALIIFHLFRAPVLRFSELRRAIPDVSQKMLIQQLRDLEGNGVVVRKVYPEVPPKCADSGRIGPASGAGCTSVVGSVTEGKSL